MTEAEFKMFKQAMGEQGLTKSSTKDVSLVTSNACSLLACENPFPAHAGCSSRPIPYLSEGASTSIVALSAELASQSPDVGTKQLHLLASRPS